MKIFKFNFDPEIDWVFANNKEEAEFVHSKISGIDDFSSCKISELPENEWCSTYLIDPNDYCDDCEKIDSDDYCNGYKIIESFKEYAEREIYPDIIATTEF